MVNDHDDDDDDIDNDGFLYIVTVGCHMALNN